MTGRPLIGVTRPDRGDRLAYLILYSAIWLCGGRPRAITASTPCKDVPFRGLVLGGGSDVYPRRFAVEPKIAYRYDQAREAVEEWWAARAEVLNLPTLGICRGAQLMNVLGGGSLHMDVSLAYEKAVYPKSRLRQAVFRKRVAIEPGSLLHHLTGRTALHVNSVHSQSIARLGTGLIVTAREPNGVVQSIESPDRTFWLGVQFHPELLLYRRVFRSIFRGFIAAARQGGDAPPLTPAITALTRGAG